MDRDSVEPQVDTLPGPNARAFVERHHDVAAPSTAVYGFVWDADAPAMGPFCTDVDGNVLMDWSSQVAAMPLGYNNPKVLDRIESFDLVDPGKIAGQDFYVDHGDTDLPTPVDLMERLTDACAHYHMDTVFLSNSGAEAVENAIKITYDFTGGKYGITFEGAFHGRTLGALSLNRSKAVQRRAFPEIASVHDLPFCRDRNCNPGTCECGFFRDSAGADGSGVASALAEKLDPKTGHVDPEEVAYVIVEPIQGEGGYQVPSDAFADEVARVCDELEVPLVVDEVQSGVGRTGEMWAADHYALEPDVIVSGKGLRVGGTVSREEVFPEEKGRLSSTWGAGDLLASAQGVATFDAIHEHDLMDNATERGRQFIEYVRGAVSDVDVVTDIRGKGLMLGVECSSRETRDELQKAAFERGLLTLGCGFRTLRILPPLDSTEREIEMGSDLLVRAAKSVA